jgi:hypothetical protein
MSCSSCHKPKANLVCGICNSSVCKSCAQFVEEDRFSFLPSIPEDLKHTTYCPECFQNKVAPEMAAYDDLMEQAKNIVVFEKDQGKETRLLKRKVPPIKVLDCPDRAETLLRLAFQAAKAGFNAIIDVDLRSEKVKINNYQTTKWSGTAVPTNIDPKWVVKDRSLWQNPN